jgi:ABC-2 type transport system permease protein
MAPRYLQKAWTSGGRRDFHYVMDAPMPAFFSVLSARWAVSKAMWGAAPIEVYYHPTHTFNVARMLEASRASLAFFSKEFGPYRHRQLRIVEVPRYAGSARSFPNTVPTPRRSASWSEYAALVVTGRLHGRAFTRKFLRAELDRYRRGRAGQ